MGEYVSLCDIAHLQVIHNICSTIMLKGAIQRRVETDLKGSVD